MTDNKQFNVRLPDYTRRQLDKLAAEHGLTITQIFILAVDQLHTHLFPNENWMVELTPAEKSLLAAKEETESQPDGVLPADYWKPID